MLTQHKQGSMLPLCFANIPTRASRCNKSITLLFQRINNPAIKAINSNLH